MLLLDGFASHSCTWPSLPCPHLPALHTWPAGDAQIQEATNTVECYAKGMQVDGKDVKVAEALLVEAHSNGMLLYNRAEDGALPRRIAVAG